MTLEKPIDYDNREGAVDVVLCLVGPSSDREAHLRLLSELARLVVESDFLSDVRRATDEVTAREAMARAAAGLTELDLSE